MSRLLGNRARDKKLYPLEWLEKLGAKMFFEGKPCPSFDRYAREKRARTRRGWMRAKAGIITKDMCDD